NTDNMSILGLTLDYGPYGWIDNFDLHWTPNTTDASGRRYRFGQQPQVAMWNLVQLANSLLPLFSGPEQLESALAEYAERFHSEWRLMMISKLGLSEWMPDTDVPLINDLTEMLELVETDMTIFFRKLAQIPVNPDTEAESTQSLTPDNEPMIPAELAPAYYSPETISQEQKTTIQDWLIRYRDRVRHDGTTDTERRIRMNAVNPKYVFRNYLAQQAIELAESGDTSRVMTLLELLRH
ncbi:MAG: protein adenylyltransferase SelO family protein, partial [Phycisphaerae bacterium]